jgi:hypothetical protein
MNNESKYLKKYLKYKAKYLSSMNHQIGGLKTYAESPNTIQVIEFAGLSSEEKEFYDSATVLTRDIPEIGITIRYYNKISPESYSRLLKLKSEREETLLKQRVERRMQIRGTPGIKISAEEYEDLPPGKLGYNWIPVTSGPQYQQTIEYVKGKSHMEIRAEKEERMRQIREVPGIKISSKEYEELPADKLGFTWIAKYSGPQWDQTIEYVKGKSQAEIAAEKEARIRQIREDPAVVITQREYSELPADKYGFKWIIAGSERVGMAKYIYTYKKESATERRKRELEDELRIIENRGVISRDSTRTIQVDNRGHYADPIRWYTVADATRMQEIRKELEALR